MARGSIKKLNGARGTRYRVRVEIASDPATGKRRWHSETCSTKRRAEERISELLFEVERGTYHRSPRTLFADYLHTVYLPWYRTRVREASYIQCEIHVRRHIVPALGQARLCDLDTMTMQRFVTDLNRAFKPSTVRAIFTTLKAALRQAVEWSILGKSPIGTAKPPPPQRREATIWTKAHTSSFLHSVTDTDIRLLFHLIAQTAMRKSEALALQWRDVDLGDATIRVERTLTRRTDLSWTVGPPKTAQGRRTLAIPNELVRELRAYRTRQDARRRNAGACWVDEDWIFDNGQGKRLPVSTADYRWSVLRKQSGLPSIRVHDLRHSGATHMLEAGIPLKVVSDYLGHAGVSITADVYQHVTETLGRQAAEALGGLLADGTPGTEGDGGEEYPGE
jgi:integrase